MNHLKRVPEFHLSVPDHCRLPLISLTLIFLLAACGYNISTPTPVPDANIYAEIETAVAQTFTARAVIPTRPTPTSTPTITPTLYITSTATVASSPTATIAYLPNMYYHCEDSTFLKDVTIPDGTILLPGQYFVKTWRFKNTGNCAWASDYFLVFVRGNRMSGYSDELDDMVAINEKVSISAELIAPTEEGNYIGYWQLADDYGDPFGDIVHVRIIVAKPTATRTATATFTLTATRTATPTSTSTSTPTSTPTSTYTATPASTSTPTYTATPTNTPESTSTSTATATMSPTPTATDLPTATSTVEPTSTSTSTSTATPEDIDTPIPTETSTATATP